MPESCPNVAIRNRKVRIVTMEGDVYFDDDPEEAKQIFAEMKSKKKVVDGSSGISSHLLYIDGEIIDTF